MATRLEQKKFREWLASRGNRWSGDAHDSYSCPLACYLSDEYDRDFEVQLTRWRVMDTGPWRPLPEWAFKFRPGPHADHRGR